MCTIFLSVLLNATCLLHEMKQAMRFGQARQRKLVQLYQRGSYLSSTSNHWRNQQPFWRSRSLSHPKTWPKLIGVWTLLRSGAWTSGRCLLMIFSQHLPCLMVTFQLMSTSQHLSVRWAWTWPHPMESKVYPCHSCCCRLHVKDAANATSTIP